MKQSFRDMAQRIVNAEVTFDEMIAERIGCTIEDAGAGREFLLVHGIAKLDPVGGRITVKHGAYLDKEPLTKAVALGRDDRARKATP